MRFPFLRSSRLTEQILDLVMQVLDARVAWTCAHSIRVARIAERLTVQLGIGGHPVEIMRVAGQLHDLGKIGVRDEILFKPGSLMDEEWEIMRRHPDIGADFLAQHTALAEMAPVVRHHHERWDGSGYPAGLKGEVIPRGARILAVAESFDYVASPPPYGPRAFRVRPTREALQDIVEHSGSWYDPAVVEALKRLFST